MFEGKYDHAVDPKGRVAVPSDFRRDLAGGSVISIGPEGRLVIWPNPAWEIHLRSLPVVAGTPSEQRTYFRQVHARTRQVELDAQGRLLLSQPHREFAGIAERATFVGMGDYVEVCSTERWEADSAHVTADFFTELTDRINPLGAAAPSAAPS